MSTLTIPKLADELFLRPIVISMNSLALSALMSYVMSANAGIDWRPIIICVTSDILAMGADHLKDKKEQFSSDRNNANDPRLASWFLYARTFLTASAVLLAFALSQCPISTLLTTATFVAPALLWTTPISFKKFWLISRRLLGRFSGDRHQPSTSAPVLVIKRIPGMKAIFNGIIRGCGIYAVVFSVLSGSGNLTNTLPSPWSVAQLLIWSTVNRSCHAIMTDVRDFEDDMKAGVPTIPVLLGSILRTKVILTACHMLVMLAFIENTYIMGSCLFAAALVWILGKDSPKKAFLFSSHSQSLFIIWYLLTRHI
ncbi:uncharacterized protein F5891DRAFT_1005197 [Suillus fuscotomentosus]|uniref:UbiA prenyltransferase n=1 Tax=Suillus fuscotomentosus TaxID=1912939 RepID=A0AAD4HRX5_9AGAM|nr:uncharacterized protein F5891DRAFT_1005197 [Suillus fuscotomentosus]KAG1906341.1 hypothetical protein F5891DRAFT_1005197 [Suillus fuscotomentosus]